MSTEVEAKPGANMQTTPWTLDRTINLPFLVTVCILFATAITFATKTDSRLSNLETTTRELPAMSAKLERMDERSVGLERDINRVMNSQAGIAK